MFLRIPDSEMKRLQILSHNIVLRAEALQKRTLQKRIQHQNDEDIQQLAQMVTQLGRITELQTQALRGRKVYYERR